MMKIIHSVVPLVSLSIFTSAMAIAQINSYPVKSSTSVIVPVQPKVDQPKALINQVTSLSTPPKDSVRYVVDKKEPVTIDELLNSSKRINSRMVVGQSLIGTSNRTQSGSH
jgi:hypothetical protein